MTHPANPEKLKKKQASALDEVHTAPYAAYAARILADEATEQGSNPLSSVLQNPEELQNPDVFTEAQVNEQIRLFKDQFNDDQKELFDIKANHFALEDLCAAYDEERGTYVISDAVGGVIEDLYLDRMHLVELYLPPALTSLKHLDCSTNELATLPALPPQLETLYCSINELTNLPELPASLKVLRCSYNKLVKLPELPTALEMISCSGNELTLLPELPPQLSELFCIQNKLVNLPELPISLAALHCSSNQLTVFPDIPPNLTAAIVDDNPFDQASIKKLRARGFNV